MHAPFSPALLNEVKLAFEQSQDLPFPVHVSDIHGNFHYANEAARKLFKFAPDEPIEGLNLISFYEDPKEREHLLGHLQRHHGGWLTDLTARLNIEGFRCKVKFASKAFFDESGQLMLMLNIADSMSTIEWFAEFENDIESGLFEVDHHLKIAGCNKKMAEMLGYDSPDEVINTRVANFLWEPNSKQQLIEELKQNTHLTNRTLKLKRKDRGMMIVRMSCIATKWDDGEIAHVKGIVHDVIFDILQKELPVGLFLINTTDDENAIFSHVNATFAKIHGYNSPTQLIGKRADAFQTDPAVHEKYMQEMDKAAQNGQALLDYFMDIYDKKGEKKSVVVNVCYVPGEDKNIRVGTVYDVTGHVVRNRHTLEAKISAVIHTYLATLNGLRDTLGNLIRAHGYGVMVDDYHIDREKTDKELQSRKRRLGQLIKNIVDLAAERKIHSHELTRLNKFWSNISTEETMPEKDNASWIRNNLIVIRNILSNMRDLGFPRETLKAIRSEIDELLRLSSLISLTISIAEINERVPDFLYFRDYLLRGETRVLEHKEINLVQLILESIQKLEGFTAYHKVRIEKHFNPKEAIYIKGNKIALIRAFHSLLHNAIKYSWSKHEGQLPWIDVQISKKPNKVEVIIENWGVPIRKEELENDFIFEYGKRGKESEDRGRAGTGIGLYDAREVFLENGGELKITSEPTLGNAADNYKKPFITRAYVTLPTII